MQESHKTVMPNMRQDSIRNKIYAIRGVQVMLDSDLAELYQVETSNLNKAVKRNIERFPENYCFKLNDDEFASLRFQIGVSNQRGGRRFLPYVFTEQGVAMLSGVLHSETAIRISIDIMNAFVSMRHFINNNDLVLQRLDRIELKQIEADDKFQELFCRLDMQEQDKAVIFFKGQIWDAISCIEEIIGNAEKSIILIDGYVDKGTLDMLSRKRNGVSVEIHTIRKNYNLTEKEISAFRKQYGKLEIFFTDEFHDRFLILDCKKMYHIGASIKDAGKKAFEISLNEDDKLVDSVLERIEEYNSGKK